MDRMDTLNVKYHAVGKALDRFHSALIFFDKAQAAPDIPILGTHEVIYRAASDSMIQRFEFSVELFWEYLRLYLEEHEKLEVEVNTPRAVIRTACQARIISEDQAAQCFAMIASRNLTSHIYKEEIAEQLVCDIPEYYELMKRLAAMLRP